MQKLKVKNSGIIKLQLVDGNPRGKLFIAESAKHIPFHIKRVYFINDLDNYLKSTASNISQPKTLKEPRRGEHAHHKLDQVIFCINGHFTLGLDDGTTKQKILMNDPAIGVRLGPKLWHSMEKFSKHCVILVFANDYYNESDYIRDYDEFLKVARKGKKATGKTKRLSKKKLKKS
jgi:WxcM-like, C-terminal